MAEAYIITSPSGKSYVGVTSMTADERLRAHIKDASTNKYPCNPLYRAIRKYGPSAFVIRTLFQGTWEYVLGLEDELIRAYGTMRPGGYNAKHGGLGGRMSPETCQQMSRNLRLRFKDPVQRERMSREQLAIWQRPGYREKMKAAHTGHKDTTETIEKKRQANLRRYEVPGAREAWSIKMKKMWADKKSREKLS